MFPHLNFAGRRHINILHRPWTPLIIYRTCTKVLVSYNYFSVFSHNEMEIIVHINTFRGYHNQKQFLYKTTLTELINLQQISRNDSLVIHFKNLVLKIFDQYSLPSFKLSRLTVVLSIVPFNLEHLSIAD